MKWICVGIILIILIGANNPVCSQNLEFDYDTSYIKSYRDYLVLTLVSVWNSNSINITDNNGDDIIFSTNLPLHLGIAADYKWLTIEYTSSFNAQTDPQLGNTESQSFGFGLTGRKFWFRNFWKKYEGYYMENREYANPNFNPDVDNYLIRPDLSTSIYFANINYGFNYRKYSNTASLWQLEKQKKSAGSFTMGLTFAYSKYGADSSLILSEWRDHFEEDALLTKYHFSLFGINGGYLYTLSLFKRRRLFLSLAIIPGLSFQTGKAYYEDGNDPPRKKMIGSQTEIRGVLGYNHNSWYTSLSGTAYLIANSFAPENKIHQNYVFFRFMLGYKIKMKAAKSPFLKKIGL